MSNAKPKVIALIQTRMGSTRLPQKALKSLGGKTLTEWIAYRLSFARSLDGVVFAIPDTGENDTLAAHGEDLGLPVHRGSETDLISRLLGAARAQNADGIVRITGDCPLVDPGIVDMLANRFRELFPNIDCVTNIFPPTYPDGMDVEVIATHTLEQLNQEVHDPLRREWLTMNIMEHPEKFRIENVPYKENLSGLRLTVDYTEDFVLAEKIFAALHQEGSVFLLEDMLRLLGEQPALLDINAKWVDKNIQQNIRSGAFHALKKRSQ